MLFFGATAILFACSENSASVDIDAHTEEVLGWRAGRLERLLAPSGFLTLSGLFWLEPGTHSFGSDASSDIVFPAAAAPLIGRFTVTAEGVSMNVLDGVEVASDDFPVTAIQIDDDHADTPTMMTHRSLAWTVIKRQDRFAVRLRDYENPALADFGPLPYFDIDPGLRVVATLHRYAEPRVIQAGTVIEGLGWNPESPGTIVFEIDGTAYDIEAYASGDSLFYVFGDASNRDDTYGAGRFLYSDLPGENGELVLDFNLSYSPPCAFNDFATCPVASPRNRLPIRIEAGEKYDAALYRGGLHSN
jgi:uncharacterized protein (DUF1684 family)